MRRLLGQVLAGHFQWDQWSVNGGGGENGSCLTMDRPGFLCGHSF
jgi:hypothetical protein